MSKPRKSFPNNLRNTRAALVKYDEGEAGREKLFNAIGDQKAFEIWEAEDKRAIEEVQEAFFQDTKSINKRADCSLVKIKTLREWCNKKF